MPYKIGFTANPVNDQVNVRIFTSGRFFHFVFVESKIVFIFFGLGVFNIALNE